MKPYRVFVLACVLLAGCGGDSGDPSVQDLSDPSNMVLRLSDLPAGYREGDDSGCGQVASTEGASPGLDAFLSETRPRGCKAEFNRAWGEGPDTVQSSLLIFETPEAARRGWAARGNLFRYVAGVLVSDEFEAESPGEEAARFDSTGLNDPGTGVAWRDGRLLAIVYEEGVTGEEGRRFAADLARKQEERIRSPEPVSETDGGREVGLDDPTVSIPVYWLGREFAPDGFPRLELYEGVHLAGRDGPGSEVKIDYSGDGASLYLDLWKPATWEAFKRTRLGRMVWDSPCTRRSEVRLDGGRATIFGGYGTDGCPKTAPNHWIAHVYLQGVVVTVNMAYCYSCGRRPADDPYNSRRGLEAVVHGLRRR